MDSLVAQRLSKKRYIGQFGHSRGNIHEGNSQKLERMKNENVKINFSGLPQTFSRFELDS